jgi:hypothetical protein
LYFGSLSAISLLEDKFLVVSYLHNVLRMLFDPEGVGGL